MESKFQNSTLIKFRQVNTYTKHKYLRQGAEADRSTGVGIQYNG